MVGSDFRGLSLPSTRRFFSGRRFPLATLSSIDDHKSGFAFSLLLRRSSLEVEALVYVEVLAALVDMLGGVWGAVYGTTIMAGRCREPRRGVASSSSRGSDDENRQWQTEFFSRFSTGGRVKKLRIRD